MRIDYEYLKKILEEFLDSSKPVLTCNDFASMMKADSQKFAFHIRILGDKSLLTNAINGTSLGVLYEWEDGYEFVEAPWRLTSSGHDFAASLATPELMTIIADRMKTEGLSAVLDLSKGFVKKKLERLLEENFV